MSGKKIQNSTSRRRVVCGLSMAFASVLLAGCDRDCNCPSAPPTAPAAATPILSVRIFRLAYISPDAPTYRASFVGGNGESVKGEPQSLIDIIKHLKTAQGTFTFEKRANALVVRDTDHALDQMQSIIDRLDVPPKTDAKTGK